MASSLTERVILIVGGTSGIGLATAHACLQVGARVAIVGPDDDCVGRASVKLSADVKGIIADAREFNAADRMIAETVSRFGRLDGIMHVAGGSGRQWGDGPLHEMTEAAWRETLMLNLDTVAWTNGAAIRHWLAAGHGGSIVNLGSVLGEFPAYPHFVTHAYATAKAALLGLVKSLADTYAGDNIRVNALSPGLVETPMASRALSDPAVMNYVARRQRLDGGRAAEADEVASAALFLLSDQSRFVTGQNLRVDGGWSVCGGGIE